MRLSSVSHWHWESYLSQRCLSAQCGQQKVMQSNSRCSSSDRCVAAYCRSRNVGGTIRSPDEMPEHREQPSEKKSQRDAKRHFRFPTYAIMKNDGNFKYV